MSAAKSNSVNPVVTRLRKRRDLETTMTTLKKLLEPSITLTKKGTRKKNKPRILAKKVLVMKKVNRFEDNSEDGEFYPNKLKRKDRMKKIILKPKHELKVVVATNKRKRGTPHKGLESLEEEPPPKEQPGLKDNPVAAPRDVKKHKCIDLKVNTPSPFLNPVKYELISPPHKSLTELTIEDLIRMDEDSLSDEDLMEVLTCPSPVWWENSPDDFRDDALYLFKTADNSPTVIRNDEKHTAEEKTPSDLSINLIDVGTRLKRTGTVSEVKSKDKKIAKLENILGNIKSRVQSADKLENRSDAKEDNNDVNDRFDGTHEKNVVIKKETDGSDVNKRSISSSSSDISVNEDDLLRNLESIDIPIQKQNTNITEKNIQNNVNANDDKNEAVNDIPKDDFDDVNLKSKENIQNSLGKSDHHDSIKEAAELNSVENPESKNKDILKRLKISDDILDVRLIQTPTNITNEVKIWSKLDNFKRHNFKPEDFDNKVIDVEDELDFHMIKSLLNSPSKECDPLDPKNDTILIDDDSNDGFDKNTESTMKDVIDLKTCNVIINKEFENDISHTEINSSKDIIKEETIRIGNVLNIRLIETEGILQNELPKQKTNKKIAVRKALKTPLESRSQLNYGKNKSNDFEIRKIKILSEESIESLPQTINATNQTYPKDAKLVRNTKNKHSKYIEQSIEDYTNQNNGTLKIIDTADNNKVLLINDVEVSLVRNTGPNIDNRINEIVKPETFVKNNDLSITLVSKQDNLKDVTVVPLTLPPLTKNPKSILESPKSIESITSESATENSEGTISDINIQFLDEYEDKNTEKYLDRKTDCNEIEDNHRQEKEQDNPNISIVDLDVTNKSRINILDDKIKDLDRNTQLIEDDEDLAFLDENNKTKSNKSMTEDLDKDNKNIEEEYLDETEDNENEEVINNIMADSSRNEINDIKTEDLDADYKSIGEEYLDEDGNNEIEEIHISISDENQQDSSFKNAGNCSRTEDFDENSKSIEEEYLDEDSDGKSIGEDYTNKDILYSGNKSRQEDLDENEGNGVTEDLEDDNKGSEEEYLDDEVDNEEQKAEKSIESKSRYDSETKNFDDDNRVIEEEYLDEEEDNKDEEANKSILVEKNSRTRDEEGIKSIDEEYLDDEEDN